MFKQWRKMAKKKPPENKGVPSGSEVQPQDRTNFFTDLSYMPSALKTTKLWFAQALYYAKKNGVPFLDPENVKRKRNLRKLKIDKGALKRIFDPVTPLGQGGDAKYVASQWETNPLYIHLMNIVTADMEKKSTYLSVKLGEEYAMLQKQKENYKMIERGIFRRLINEVNELIGLPQISNQQDPHKYAEALVAKINNKNPNGKPLSTVDTPQNYAEMIRNQCEDDEDYAMYNELIYKGDIEPALEKGIQEYLIKQNKWAAELGNKFLSDIIDHNACIGMKYTDLTTGRPVVEYLYNENVRINPIKTRNGEDLMYAFSEDDITFGDWVRKMGRNLSQTDMVNIFEYVKQQGIWGTYADIREIPFHTRDNTRIRIGRFFILTQDFDTFSDQYVRGNNSFHTRDFSWEPSDYAVSNYAAKKETLHYNVWYSCWYMPPTMSNLDSANYQWQANFIWEIQKNVDMERWGPDGRFVKSDFVMWRDLENPSFSDIVWLYMPFINIAWVKFQNELVQAIPSGGRIIAQELLGAMMNAVDGTNKDKTGDGKAAAKAAFDQLRQTGKAIGKFTDSKGEQIVDPSKFVVNLQDTGIMAAKELLEIISMLYGQMTQALAISDAREGQDLKPRQALGGAELALEASNQGTWLIERAYTQVLEMFGERMIQHIHNIMIEYKVYGYKDRFEDFKASVGEANGLMLEGIAKIPLEQFSLFVKQEDTSAKKDYILNLADSLAKGGALDFEIIDLLIKIDNWKEAFVLMKMNFKKKKRELQEQAKLEHDRRMQELQMQGQNAMAQNQQNAQNRLQEIDKSGQIEAMLTKVLSELKTQSQAILGNQRKDNKIEEAQVKSGLKIQEEQAKSLT